MARSFKHTPKHGHCGTSDATLKTKSHRIIRSRVRLVLSQVTDRGESLCCRKNANLSQ
jgi:hypothetical protein